VNLVSFNVTDESINLSVRNVGEGASRKQAFERSGKIARQDKERDICQFSSSNDASKSPALIPAFKKTVLRIKCVRNL
jgi:hypothetical protein